VVVEITLPTEELILRMRWRRAHIDDQLIEQAHRLNAYYSHGAVESFYGPKTPLLSFDNSRRSTPDQLQQFVVQLVSKIQAKI
jgi:hypothetical protein